MNELEAKIESLEKEKEALRQYAKKLHSEKGQLILNLNWYKNQTYHCRDQLKKLERKYKRTKEDLEAREAQAKKMQKFEDLTLVIARLEGRIARLENNETKKAN